MASSAEKTRSESSDNSASSAGFAGEVTILRGLVVGSPQSGKTSLLRRLRGEQLNHAEKRRLMALLPWRIPDVLRCPVDVANAAVAGGNATELVQLYLAEAQSFSLPPGIDQSDHYQQTIRNDWKDVLHRTTKKYTLDFIVWIIDSRLNLDELLHFVNHGLECLFPPHHAHLVQNDTTSDSDEPGHKQGHNNHTNETPPSTAHEKNHESYSPLVQNLCILLNFRDLQNDSNENGDNPSSLLHQVRDVADAILARHTTPATLTPKTHNQSQHRPSVLIYESSMITNYGIQSLHSFITLPYLLHKEREYARRLVNVQREYDRVKHELILRNDKDSKADAYDAFIKKNGAVAKNDEKRKTERIRIDRDTPTPTRSAHDQRKSKPDPKSVVADETSNKKTEIRKFKPDPKSGVAGIMDKRATEVSRQLNNQEVTAPPVHVESNTHRRLFPSLQQSSTVATTATTVWTPLDNSNDNNLDSFFSDEEESDDDVEEAKHDFLGRKNTTGKGANGASNNHVLDSDNDSSSSHSHSHTDGDDGENSDDDFFIDSAGNRHTHASPFIKGGDIKGRMFNAETQCGVEVVQSAKPDTTDVELEEKKEDGEASVHDAAKDDGHSIKKNLVDDGNVHIEDDEENNVDYNAARRDPPTDEVVENEDIENENSVRSNEVHDEAPEESDLDYDINNGDISERDDGEQVIGESVHNNVELMPSKPCVEASTNARFETEPIEANSEGDVDADDDEEVTPLHGGQEMSSRGFDREFSLSGGSTGQDSSATVNETNTTFSESETEQTMYDVKTTDKRFTAVTKKCNDAFQSKMVLDSDDESTGVPNSKVDSRAVELDDHEYYVDAIETKVQHPPHKRKILPTQTNETMSEIKATPSLSNAALAAIEAARLDAERALGESNSKSKEKKTKKESKKKSSKSKKSKKKEAESL